MPRHPPKRWFGDCTKGVKRSGSAADPRAVCGDLWFHKLSESERRRVREMYEGRRHRPATKRRSPTRKQLAALRKGRAKLRKIRRRR